MRIKTENLVISNNFHNRIGNISVRVNKLVHGINIKLMNIGSVKFIILEG